MILDFFIHLCGKKVCKTILYLDYEVEIVFVFIENQESSFKQIHILSTKNYHCLLCFCLQIKNTLSTDYGWKRSLGKSSARERNDPKILPPHPSF